MGKSEQLAIHKTLCFFNLIKRNLSIEEVKALLYSEGKDVSINDEEIRNIISAEYDSPSEKLDWINLYDKAVRWKWVFKLAPFIRYVAICNSVSFHTSDRDSDIDLFIITKDKKIWTARLCITFLLHILKLRRHGKHIKRRFCLSFFTTENSCSLEKIAIQNDIYLIYWTKLLHPIYTSDQFTENFFKSNEQWLKQYLHDPRLHSIDETKTTVLQKILETILSGKLGDYLENFAKKIQHKRAIGKLSKISDPSGTIISDNILKFHDCDIRVKITQQWKEMYTKHI